LIILLLVEAAVVAVLTSLAVAEVVLEDFVQVVVLL
jgi:hypothetical protein